MRHNNLDEETIEGNLVKVRYSFDFTSQREKSAIIGALTGIALMITAVLFIIINPRSLYNDLYLAAFAIVPIYISVPIVISERKQRMESKQVHEDAVKNGEKIIGTIVDLANVDLGGRTAGDRSFSYSIEYEGPKKNEMVSIQTPPAITENMFITEKDLPLKAVVYIYKNKGYIDAVVDPPIIAMSARHLAKIAPLILILACPILCMVFYGIGLIPIAGGFYIAGILFAVLYLYILKRRK